MAIYHLNCGSMQVFFPRVNAMTYCLLVETSMGLLLVDTGSVSYTHLTLPVSYTHLTLPTTPYV